MLRSVPVSAWAMMILMVAAYMVVDSSSAGARNSSLFELPPEEPPNCKTTHVRARVSPQVGGSKGKRSAYVSAKAVTYVLLGYVEGEERTLTLIAM